MSPRLQKKKDVKINLKQAVICPMSSPMYVDSNTIVHGESKDENENGPKTLKIFTRMAPGGDKTNTVDIDGLKIFVKF